MSRMFVEILRVRGSAPRDAGTAMMVKPTSIQGTIGGGALEHEAIALARRLLAGDGPETTRSFALGPDIGQCCGGSVTLRFTRQKRATDVIPLVVHPLRSHRKHPAHLWLWGAGHVGRAVVRACPPDAFKITWVDVAADRFPPHIGGHVSALPAVDMPLLAGRAPDYAHHLVFTYAHDIDLALCAALLKRNVASIGLIGSSTKWARFQKRLRAQGLDPSGITCPIGDKLLGKTPDAIARGAVADLLDRTTRKATA